MTADPDYSYPHMVEEYKRQIEKHGVGDVRSLLYHTRGTQIARMHAMMRVLQGMPIESVLDVGCGTGDLIPYLLMQTSARRYVGVDVVTEFITEAKRKWDHQNRGKAFSPTFYNVDYLTVPPTALFNREGTYDAVLACGLVSFQPEHIAVEMMERLWRQTKHVMIFNCVFDQPLSIMTVNYYFKQWGIKWWEYHQTYLENDFMVVARKEKPA